MGNAVSSLPRGAQSSQLQVDLACTAPDNNFTEPRLPLTQIVLTTTSPLYGGAGQQISFSDVAGSVALPFDALYQQEVGGKNFAINITVSFGVSNALPETLSYTQSSFGRYNSVPIPLPFDIGTVLPPLGPVTLGDEGQISDFTLSQVAFSLQSYSVSGSRLGDVLTTTCTPVKLAPINVGYQAIISSTFIDNSTGAQAPSTGTPGTFPNSRNAVKAVTANIPISCKSARQISSTNDYNLSFSAWAPPALINGQSFSLTNVDSFVTVPGDILALLSTFFGGTTAAGFVDLGQNFIGAGIKGPGLGAVLDNASPSSFDIAKDFTNASDSSTARPLFTGRYFPVGENKPITFPLPQFGALSFDNLSAGEVSTIFGLTISRLQAIISVSSSRGEFDGSDNIDCAPTHPYALLRAPILPA